MGLIFIYQYSTSAEGGGPGFPGLTVNEDADSFSLCPVTAAGGVGETVVVWGATADNEWGYDVNACWEVDVLVIENQ